MGKYLRTTLGPSSTRAACFASFEVPYLSIFNEALEGAGVSGQTLKAPCGSFALFHSMRSFTGGTVIRCLFMNDGYLHRLLNIASQSLMSNGAHPTLMGPIPWQCHEVRRIALTSMILQPLVHKPPGNYAAHGQLTLRFGGTLACSSLVL